MALERAVRQRVFETNPARLVDNLSTEDHHERRAFTQAELKKLLAVCKEDWTTAVIVGIYTGLRLGDIQALTWANLRLQQKELTIRTQKTGRVQILPLAKPLLRHIETLPAGDDPQAPLCPSFQGKTVSWLSNQFYEIMASAGLVQSRGDHQKKEGRSARRQLSPISFHALRHTATRPLCILTSRACLGTSSRLVRVDTHCCALSLSCGTTSKPQRSQWNPGSFPRKSVRSWFPMLRSFFQPGCSSRTQRMVSPPPNRCPAVISL